MFVKCFIVKINSALESMYEELADAGLDYSIEIFEDGYMTVTFETWSEQELRDAYDIMKWYV